jgi:hypothetical protein
MKRPALSLSLVLLASQAVWAVPDDPQPTAKRPVNTSTEKQPNPKDVEAARYIKEVAAKFGKHSEAEAKTAIEKLVAIWKDKDVADTTTDSIPPLLERFAKQDEVAVAVAAIEALGELEPWAGAPPVVSVLQQTIKAKAPQQDVYVACFAALKKLADPKAATLKTIEDCLDHRLDDVIAGAADSITGYKDAPGDVRRQLFEELVKQFEGVFNASLNTKKSPAQAQKWGAVGGPVMAALNALSRQSFKDPAQARQWLNDHKDDKSWR